MCAQVLAGMCRALCSLAALWSTLAAAETSPFPPTPTGEATASASSNHATTAHASSSRCACQCKRALASPLVPCWTYSTSSAAYALGYCLHAILCVAPWAASAALLPVQVSAVLAAQNTADPSQRLLAYRWYPTAVKNWDGRLLIASGLDLDTGTGCASVWLAAIGNAGLPPYCSLPGCQALRPHGRLQQAIQVQVLPTACW